MGIGHGLHPVQGMDFAQKTAILWNALRAHKLCFRMVSIQKEHNKAGAETGFRCTENHLCTVFVACWDL